MKFVMVPGGWQGGWVFDSVGAELRRWGHQVEAVTLAGLELEGSVDVERPANLDAHVEQVVEIVASGNGMPVALCGHSYGEMVIAGVALRLSGDAKPVYGRMFVSGGDWAGSPFLSLTERLRDDPDWRVEEIPVGHNVARRDPDALAAVLHALAADR